MGSAGTRPDDHVLRKPRLPIELQYGDAGDADRPATSQSCSRWRGPSSAIVSAAMTARAGRRRAACFRSSWHRLSPLTGYASQWQRAIRKQTSCSIDPLALASAARAVLSVWSKRAVALRRGPLCTETTLDARKKMGQSDRLDGDASLRSPMRSDQTRPIAAAVRISGRQSVARPNASLLPSIGRKSGPANAIFSMSWQAASTPARRSSGIVLFRCCERSLRTTKPLGR
jgi:hypothetical protein